jgi:uncharacterized protein YdcH (DUF465 family)
VDDQSLSEHVFVLGKQKSYIPDLSDGRWMNYFVNWNPQNFCVNHKNLSIYDGFISAYPPIFSTLYLDFQKPSIMHIPIRFDYGVQSHPESLRKFIEAIRTSKNLFISTNSKYDTHYFKFLTGIECETIPSMCDYTGLQYIPGNSNKTLIYHVTGLDLSKISFPYLLKTNLPPRYHWTELLKYKAIVHFPYQVSTMSIFEHYSANIPLFFPTKKFLHELYFNKQGVLSQVSHHQVWNTPPKTPVEFEGDVDLNDYTNPRTIQAWIEDADYYDEEWMPFTQLFDSFEELNEKINTINLQEISNNMKQFNVIRKEKIYSKWRKRLNEISNRLQQK